MIAPLDLQQGIVATAAHILQRAAYEREAELIGSREIPPLKESLAELRASRETFWGYFRNGILAGFVATEPEPPRYRISRLVVSPKFSRQGIGRALLDHALSTREAGQSWVVSTADLNTPAQALYEKAGFERLRVFEASGIKLVEYQRMP